MSSSFDTFSNDDTDSIVPEEEENIQDGSFGNGEEIPVEQEEGFRTDPHVEYASVASPFSMPESNGQAYGVEENIGVFVSDSPILPEPEEMREEGFLLREWRR